MHRSMFFFWNADFFLVLEVFGDILIDPNPNLIFFLHKIFFLLFYDKTLMCERKKNGQIRNQREKKILRKIAYLWIKGGGVKSLTVTKADVNWGCETSVAVTNAGRLWLICWVSDERSTTGWISACLLQAGNVTFFLTLWRAIEVTAIN